MYKCLSFQEYQLLACAIKASPFFANTLLEANLNRDVLFDFMKGHEMYFLVIAIMTNWPRHLIKDFWEFFANSIITGKTLKARCLQISAHEENLKRNLYVVTLDIIIISCCSCSGEIFFWWSVKQRNASKSTVSCVFGVEVVVDSHQAVTFPNQGKVFYLSTRKLLVTELSWVKGFLVTILPSKWILQWYWNVYGLAFW